MGLHKPSLRELNFFGRHQPIEEKRGYLKYLMLELNEAVKNDDGHAIFEIDTHLNRLSAQFNAINATRERDLCDEARENISVFFEINEDLNP